MSTFDPSNYLRNVPSLPTTDRGDFKLWREGYLQQIAQRGTSDDVKAEEKHLNAMMRNLLRSHICYREVDIYGKCLVDNDIVKKEEIGLVNTDIDPKRAEKKCKKELLFFNSCMLKQDHHNLIMEVAANHKLCREQHQQTITCLENAPLYEGENKHPTKADKGKKTVPKRYDHRPECFPIYRRLLICGMNFMWQEYVKAISGADEVEHEKHVYEAAKSSSKTYEVFQMAKKYQERLEQEEKLEAAYREKNP